MAQPSQLESENPNGPSLSKLLRIKGNNICKYLAQCLARGKVTSYSAMNYQYLLTWLPLQVKGKFLVSPAFYKHFAVKRTEAKWPVWESWIYQGALLM